jgi:hypothetical protein
MLSWYPLSRGLGEPHSQFRHFGEETNLLPCKESNPGSSSPKPNHPHHGSPEILNIPEKILHMILVGILVLTSSDEGRIHFRQVLLYGRLC